MRKAIAIPIACCTECSTSYNFYEFNDLPFSTSAHAGEEPPIDQIVARSDGMGITLRECDHCGEDVRVAGFHLMDHHQFWQPWEVWIKHHPETNRTPVLIGENRFESFYLRVRRGERNRHLMLALLVVCVALLGLVRP